MVAGGARKVQMSRRVIHDHERVESRVKRARRSRRTSRERVRQKMERYDEKIPGTAVNGKTVGAGDPKKRENGQRLFF